MRNVSVPLPVGFTAEDDVTYVIEESKLPDGVTYNASSNSFTVNNATQGTSGTISIRAYYEGWANKEVTFTVNVTGAVKLTGSTSLTPNKAYSATVSQDIWVPDPDLGAQEAGVVSAKINVSGLPVGLTFDAAKGTISGTPTTAGEYDVTFQVEVTQRAWSGWGQWGSWRDTTTKYAGGTVTLTVGELVTVTADGVEYKVQKGQTMTAPEAPEAPAGQQFVGWYNGDTKFDFSKPITENIELTAKFEDIPDSIEFRVNEETGMIQASINGGEWVDVIALDDITGPKGDQGPAGPAGPTGPAGADGEDGQDGKDAEGGCGSSIGMNAAVLFSVVLGLACVSLVVVKKASKKR